MATKTRKARPSVELPDWAEPPETDRVCFTNKTNGEYFPPRYVRHKMDDEIRADIDKARGSIVPRGMDHVQVCVFLGKDGGEEVARFSLVGLENAAEVVCERLGAYLQWMQSHLIQELAKSMAEWDNENPEIFFIPSGKAVKA